MRIRSIVSREAHVLTAWYDLMRCPGLFKKNHLYTYYFGDMSRLLYFNYLVEKKKLWAPLLKCICLGIGCNNPLIQKALDIIQSMEVYGWSEFERYVKTNLIPRIEKLFDKTLHAFQDFVRKAFSVDIDGVKELYVIYGFNPGNGLYGSLLYCCKDFFIISSFVNEYTSPEAILDLIYHEILHAIVRLYELIPDEIEEELIDSLAPEGYLSLLLGLTSKVHVSEGRVSKIIEEYFRNKLFEKGVSIYQYLLQKLDRE